MPDWMARVNVGVGLANAKPGRRKRRPAAEPPPVIGEQKLPVRDAEVSLTA
jgi:hypothetical protein